MSNEPFDAKRLESFAASVRRLPFANPTKIVEAAQQLAHQASISTVTVGNDPSPFATISAYITIYIGNASNLLLFDLKFPKQYPTTKPEVFLNFDKNFFSVTPDHEYIASDGKLKIPCLTAWSPNSSIDNIVRNIRESFSRKWPLVAVDPRKRDLLLQLHAKEAADAELVHRYYTTEISHLQSYIFIFLTLFIISYLSHIERNKA